MLESVSVLRRSGVPLIHFRGNGDIKGSPKEVEDFDPDFSMVGGIFSAALIFSQWMGDRLQAVVLEKRTLWVESTENFVVIVTVKRNHSPFYNMAVNQVAWELTERFCKILNKILCEVPHDVLIEDSGICDLIGQIVLRESGRLADSKVREVASSLTRFDYEPSFSFNAAC